MHQPRPLQPLEPRLLLTGTGGDEPAWLSHGGHCACGTCCGATPAHELDLLRPTDFHSTDFDGAADPSGDPDYPIDDSAPAGWTIGEKSILYIRIDFDDLQGEPISTGAVDSVLNQFDDLVTDSSYGLFSVSDWETTATLRMPQTKAWYEQQENGYLTLLQDARGAAADAGFDYLDHWSYIVSFKKISGGSFSGWAGRGYVGWRGVWLNGNGSFEVTAHELGHNLGAGHANYLDSNGYEQEYGDPYGVMGLRGVHDFSPAHKFEWGWLTGAQARTLQSSAFVRLFAHDEGELGSAFGQQTYAVRIPRDGFGDERPYWIEYRTDIQSWDDGLIFTYGRNGSNDTTLIDMTPASEGSWYSDRYDAPLTLGRSFYDASLGMTVIHRGTGTYEGRSWLDVRVIFDADLPTPDAFEDNGGNNTAGNATPLQLQGSHYDANGLTIHQPGDVDWYQYTADRAGVLTISINHDHDAGDLGLIVLDGDYTELGRSLTDDDTESVTVRVTEGQTLLLRVGSEIDDFNPDYDLSLDLREPTPTRPDFNGDGWADLIWRNTDTGGAIAWLMRDGERIGKVNLPWLPADWELLTGADFNDDGHTDLLWRKRSDGSVRLWTMDADLNRVGAAATLPNAGIGFALAGVADTNDDGNLDLVWAKKRSNQARIWRLDNAAGGYDRVGVNALTGPAGQELQGVLDYDDDGDADLLWRDRFGERNPTLALMTGLQTDRTLRLRNTPTGTRLAAVLDADGDGRLDFLYRGIRSAANTLWTRDANADDLGTTVEQSRLQRPWRLANGIGV